jgi:hypothetical protein
MDFEAACCTQIEAAFQCFLLVKREFFVVVRTTVIWHRFRGVVRGKIRTTVQIFWAQKSRQKFGTVGCCKLFLLAVNVLLLLIYLS